MSAPSQQVCVTWLGSRGKPSRVCLWACSNELVSAQCSSAGILITSGASSTPRTCSSQPRQLRLCLQRWGSSSVVRLQAPQTANGWGMVARPASVLGATLCGMWVSSLQVSAVSRWIFHTGVTMRGWGLFFTEFVASAT
jgi:hypothetical protein